MADPRRVAWADAVLRRPAVDPDIPRADRILLTAQGTLLTPASRTRPARTRDYLPADPAKREATVEGAVIGLVAAGCVAVGGTTPLAIGVLVFSGPVAWQSASSHVALILAQLIAIVTAVIFGVRIVRFGQLNGQAPANVAARAYHGRYLTGADFDARARFLLRRAQDAVDAVTTSEVYRAGFLDAPAARAALADQEWDIAVALREQARLRAQRAELGHRNAGAMTAALRKRQSRAAQLRTPASPPGSPRSSATRPRSARPTPPTGTGSRPAASTPSRAGQATEARSAGPGGPVYCQQTPATAPSTSRSGRNPAADH